MPNMCHDFLTVTGPADALTEFRNHGIDFDKVIPYPRFRVLDDAAQAYEDAHPSNPWQGRPKDGFNSGGYEWCVKHWGTKWNPYKELYFKATDTTLETASIRRTTSRCRCC